MNRPTARNLINLHNELTFFKPKTVNEQTCSQELDNFAQWADIFFNEKPITEQTNSQDFDKFAQWADIFLNKDP